MSSIFISMPLSSEEVQLQTLDTKEKGIPISSSQSETATSIHPQPSNWYPQPMPEGHEPQEANNQSGIKAFKVKRFDSFKTWSGRLERKLLFLRRKRPRKTSEDGSNISRNPDCPLPVDRYFGALEGPELETLRASEETVLPQDMQWPFLLRIPIASFGICLGVGSQAILWKVIATSTSTKYLHISLKVNLVFWIISIALLATLFTIYLLKIILYFEAVRREYYHPIRVNFFFAPWISLLFLAIGVPPSVAKELPHALWYILMTPIFCLELKIYGQWMSGCQRRLSKVANPTNHLSIVGNFVGALLGASMGLTEGPIFFYAVGLAHYIVLFVTLYQRLPTNETLPKELSFCYPDKLFQRIHVDSRLHVSKTIFGFLTLISTLIVTALLVSTILHAFVYKDLFPNDLAIAISSRKRRPQKKWLALNGSHGHSREIENYLKFANSDKIDLEASTPIPNGTEDSPSS
ncbi:unnamed protein product [Sphenostylis stenocarpa]|uniref:Uncharacterized protein n=1 Tax=Sphenostylis stenocarpa TaxID=92480 RepID=A0AA86VD48_9FABA|nr:unnamed protein product [Sphenostylis stenocarpa]